MTNPPLIETCTFETCTVDEYGQIWQQRSCSTQRWVENLGAAVDLEFVKIPGGTLQMGAPQTEEGWHSTQSPQHEVTIAPFWMGIYPVTQAQWQQVAALPSVERALATTPACFLGEMRPVEQVSWYEAVEFCARLTRQTGWLHRLPTEAEWEYACRAGTSTPFHFGETISTDLANYSGVNWEYQGKLCSKGAYGKGSEGSDRRETTSIQAFGFANAFGLYNMHGQVREWCQDCWHINYANAPTDGSAWITAGDCNQRILRGGSWNTSPKACRSAFRSKLDPDSSLYDIGFRVVCAIEEDKRQEAQSAESSRSL